MRRSGLVVAVVAFAGATALGGSGTAAADPPPVKTFTYGQCVALGWAFPSETGPDPLTVNRNNENMPPVGDGGAACRKP